MIADLHPALVTSATGSEDHSLAARYAPIIRFDAREPFLPLAAGYTVFRADGPSPSFPRLMTLQPEGALPAAVVIEYAIWWDWDIQHLYELEHVWVYLDDASQIVHSEASWHGGYHAMRHDGSVPCEGEHVVVLAEPGKHAFAPDPSWFVERGAPHPRSVTTALAGLGGLLVKDLFKAVLCSTPLTDTLVRTYLTRCAFTPCNVFSTRFTFEPEQLMPWPTLRDWIPQRIAWWIAQLVHGIPPEQYRPLRIGHRGAAAHAPDNTLLGIAAAARLGADAVEIDLHLTRDGTVVASHNPYLRDRAGQMHRISTLTSMELHTIGVMSGVDVPTLDEVVSCCRDQRVGLYLELKDDTVIQPMLARLAACDNAEFVLVGSFRPDWLATVRALASDMVTSVLFSAPEVDAVALAAACGATYVHPCWERHGDRPDELLTPEWITRVRAAGLGIISWHEERPEVITGLRQRGVDAICSDQPELLH